MFYERYLATTIWCDIFWMLWPHRIVAEMHWAHSEYVTWIYKSLYRSIDGYTQGQLATGRVARLIHDCETARRVRLMHVGYNEHERFMLYECAMVARLERVPPNTPRYHYLTRACHCECPWCAAPLAATADATTVLYQNWLDHNPWENTSAGPDQIFTIPESDAITLEQAFTPIDVD